MLAAFFRRGSPWPWLTLLVVSAAIVAGIAWDVWPRTGAPPVLARRPQAEPAAPAVVAERVRVRMFFPHKTQPKLVEEERELARQPIVTDAVRTLLHELSRPGDQATTVGFPASAEIRQVFLDTFGILYLDFGKSLQALVAKDPGRADLALSAIILTLTTNLSEVKRVQFLAEGRELAAQIGTTDLRRPLQPRFPGEEPQQVISQPPGGTP